ncbi:MAG: hypothetical protein PHH93_11685 [Prolixibacteraceae bacterium]|nr:hypothetical protein [Prolixibacteraceae bacterium]
MKNNYSSQCIVIKITKQSIYVGVLTLLSVIISYKALAQVSSKERIIIAETHTMDLYPDNDNYIKSFPLKLESKGTLVGNITCQTQGNVPPDYNHLVFILHHKDNYKDLHTKDYRNFKDKAILSYSVSENDIVQGNEFIFRVRLNHAQARCNCSLNITFSESMPIEKIDGSKVPVPVVTKPAIPQKRIPVRRQNP